MCSFKNHWFHTFSKNFPTVSILLFIVLELLPLDDADCLAGHVKTYAVTSPSELYPQNLLNLFQAVAQRIDMDKEPLTSLRKRLVFLKVEDSTDSDRASVL